MKSSVFTVLKMIALSAIMFVLFGLASAAAGLQDTPQPADQAGNAALALVAICLLNSAVLAFIIIRSRWSGLKLMATMFLAHYGVTTLMSQIESAIFITKLPPGILPRLFLMGAFIAAPFSVLSVLILGKGRKAAPDAGIQVDRSSTEWLWKVGVIVVAYIILYFTFGYFIAWQSPAVREYYGGVDEGSFFANMRSLIETSPWLFGVQAIRALLWVVIALPVINMLKGSRLETAILTALLFSVVMNTQLLLPNPYMPDAVRMAHLVETASSNFLFGFLVGWLLSRTPNVENRAVEQLEAA